MTKERYIGEFRGKPEMMISERDGGAAIVFKGKDPGDGAQLELGMVLRNCEAWQLREVKGEGEEEGEQPSQR